MACWHPSTGQAEVPKNPPSPLCGLRDYCRETQNKESAFPVGSAKVHMLTDSIRDQECKQAGLSFQGKDI